MMNQKPILLALTCCLVLLASGATTTGNHDTRYDDRIVQPYGLQVFTHVPVVAGYEPLPPPVPCQVGQGLTDPLYTEDFEDGPDWTFTETPLAWETMNLWHTTDWPGPGSDEGHDAPGRLYFGFSEDTAIGMPGTYHVHEFEHSHVAGTASSPPIALPDAPALALSFNTKWAGEWLKGYDHMWVELLDESGNVHLLCSNNSLDRADATSGGNGHRIGSCSPILIGPCPTGDPTSWPNEPNNYPTDSLPGWHTRTTSIPASLAGETVRVRFTFDSADGVANQFLGWMVDDVQVGIP